MNVILRDYQGNVINEIYAAWDTGQNNTIAVLPTGSGKSVCISSIAKRHKGAAIVVAHRQELVSQMSLHLARDGIRHRIIGSEKVVNMCIRLQLEQFGQSFNDPQSKIAVAGVQTLIRRGKPLAKFLPTVSLWIIDEAHHVQKKNMWGKAVEMLSRDGIKGLGVTATPTRTDGGGLGRSSDGVFDKLIVGTDMRTLINRGYLTEYRIFAPVNNLSLDEVKISAFTGEYSDKDLSEAVSKSTLVQHDTATMVGDVVKSYMKFANGKLGITFVPSMKVGHEITAQYNSMGIPAELINAKTPDEIRADVNRRFENRELLQLVNIDIFSEGYDLPALEVVSMARPTQSKGMYNQQFGRVLRPMKGKTYGIIIDHVGNVAQHGLPDSPQSWTLARRNKREKTVDDSIPVKTCPLCFSVYERFLTICPYCKTKPPIANRASIKHVDGDLTELSPEALAEMRGEVAEVDDNINNRVMKYRQQLLNNHCKPAYIRGHVVRMTNKMTHQQDSQTRLRQRMAWWGGFRRAEGRSDPELFKIFYLKYGISWVEAQALPGDEADALYNLIDDLGVRNITGGRH